MSTTNITPVELIIHSCLWNNCTEHFASLPELAAHIAAVHIMPLSSVNSIYCKWNSCQYNFQTAFALIQHIYSQHLSTVNNQANYQEMVRPYYPYYYYSQGYSSNIYPHMDQRFYQSYNNLIQQQNAQDIQRSYYTYIPHTYQNNNTITQNVQSRTPAQTAILALDESTLNNYNNETTSTEQNLLQQDLQYQPIVNSQSSSSSLVIRQNKMSQIVNHNSTLEKEDPPIQFFAHSKSSSASTQNPQDQISYSDLKEEIEELRNLVRGQKKELDDKSQDLDKMNDEMKNLLDNNNEKSREIIKLTNLISLRDNEIGFIKESLELQTNVSKLLQEQNRRADDKLRRMWAEMLCRKADLNEKRERVLNGYNNNGKNINDDPLTSSSSSSSKKRVRNDDDDSDLHPMELPVPPHENISIITEAIMCNWEGCGKTYRTKLALKAHIVSTHMGEEILKVPVINP